MTLYPEHTPPTPRQHAASPCAAMVAGLMLALAGAAHAAPALTPLSIADAVSDELIADPAVPGYRIDVAVADNDVTLRGTVDNLLAKQRAARLARTVRGVASVDNQIDVESSWKRTDAQIERDIKDALLNDPAADSYEVTVDVVNNQAILSGTVDSYQERALAAKVAKSVRGVEQLINNIDVRYNRDRRPGEIEADIREALKWDTLVDAGLIRVSVDDDEVSLSGAVGSAAEKNRAELLSWVAGVRDVNADDLTVRDWARTDAMADVFDTRTDDQIHAALTRAMVRSPRVNSFNITSDVDDGELTLRGQVDNLAAKQAAAQVAWRTSGVTDVNNRLNVRPSADLTDDQIEDHIRDALERNLVTERNEYTVSVSNGIAYLGGFVDSAFERRTAEDVAATVDGVEQIVNTVDVEHGNAYVIEPYADDPFPFGYDWYVYDADVIPTTPDRRITQDIRDELWWSPFVDSDDVKVSVDQGIATLTGTVDSWSELLSAEENALEGGATAVVNELDIE